MCFFFQAEDGIRDLVRSRGLGDVYKRQGRLQRAVLAGLGRHVAPDLEVLEAVPGDEADDGGCLLYTSDAADERSSVDLGGRRIIKKNNNTAQDNVGTGYHRHTV